MSIKPGKRDLHFHKHFSFTLNPRTYYLLGFLVLFPSLMAAHGLVWINTRTSFVPSVYGMKLVFVPFLIVSIYLYIRTIVNDKVTWALIAIATPCFIIGSIAPLIHGSEIGFYYYSDAAGLAVVFGSTIILFKLLDEHVVDIEFFAVASKYFLIIVSIYIVIYFFVSGGEKVSITPEFHIPMALALGALAAPISSERPPPLWMVPLLALVCTLSQLRENMILFMFIVIVCAVRMGFTRRLTVSFVIIVVASLAVVWFTPLTQGIIAERIATMNPVTGEDRGGHAALFVDTSLNQRFDEIRLMYEEMTKSPGSFIIGMGFGATYLNTNNLLTYYDEFVHNAHATPFLILFRNGLYGLLLYIIPALVAVLFLFRSNEYKFRTALPIVSIYLALMINQYLYWNVQIGVVFALLLHGAIQHGKFKDK